MIVVHSQGGQTEHHAVTLILRCLRVSNFIFISVILYRDKIASSDVFEALH